MLFMGLCMRLCWIRTYILMRLCMVLLHFSWTDLLWAYKLQRMSDPRNTLPLVKAGLT